MRVLIFNNFEFLFIWLCQALVEACEHLAVACGIQLPYQGSKPGPLNWEHGAIATGPPGKSQFLIFHQTLSYHNLKQSELPLYFNY